MVRCKESQGKPVHLLYSMARREKKRENKGNVGIGEGQRPEENNVLCHPENCGFNLNAETGDEKQKPVIKKKTV